MKETILFWLCHLFLKKLLLEESLTKLENLWIKLETGEESIKNIEQVKKSLFHLHKCSIAFTNAISRLFETLNQEN